MVVVAVASGLVISLFRTLSSQINPHSWSFTLYNVASLLQTINVLLMNTCTSAVRAITIPGHLLLDCCAKRIQKL